MGLEVDRFGSSTAESVRGLGDRMNHRIRHRLILIQLLIAKMVILCVPVFAQNPSRTFLEKFCQLEEKCIRCHGAERQESMIRLDTLSTNLMSDRSVAEDWHEVLQVIDAAEMPPEDEAPLSEEQYEIEWMGSPDT